MELLYLINNIFLFIIIRAPHISATYGNSANEWNRAEHASFYLFLQFKVCFLQINSEGGAFALRCVTRKLNLLH